MMACVLLVSFFGLCVGEHHHHYSGLSFVDCFLYGHLTAWHSFFPVFPLFMMLATDVCVFYV